MPTLKVDLSSIFSHNIGRNVYNLAPVKFTKITVDFRFFKDISVKVLLLWD